MRPLAVTGYGAVTAHGASRTAFREALARGAAATGPRDGSPLVADDLADAHVFDAREFEAADVLGQKGLRNFDRMTKMMIVAGKLALEDAGAKRDGDFVAPMGPEGVGIVSSTAYGSLEAITELNLVAEKEDPRYINPARFPNTVINAAAGYVSIWEDLRAPNVTIVDGNCGALDAILTAETHLTCRRGAAYLLGGGEAISDTLVRGMRKLGALARRPEGFAPGSSSSEGTLLGECAVYLVVERAHDAKARDATVLAEICGYGAAFSAATSEALVAHASADAVERAVRGALTDARVAPEDVDLVVASYSGLPDYDAAEREGLRRVLGERAAATAPKGIFGETLGAGGAVGLAVAVEALTGANVALLSGQRAASPKTVLVTAVGYYGNVSAAIVRGAEKSERT